VRQSGLPRADLPDRPVTHVTNPCDRVRFPTFLPPGNL